MRIQSQRETYALRMATAEPLQMSMEHLDPHLVYDREREVSDDPMRGWRKRTVPLVEDVKKNGIRMPLTMETDGHLGILSDGNHRAAAAKIAGLPTVPVRFQRADTRYLSRGGGVPLHPSVQQHLADHPEALLDHVERQPSWAQGER
jgi:hypothetical protein